jgi:hypothetical protein
MPYIKSNNDRRQRLQESDVAQNAGELNYQIFYYIKHNEIPNSNFCLTTEQTVALFVENFLGETRNYQKYNDMIGCLVCSWKEIKRRLGINADFLLDIIEYYDEEIAIYEDKKIIENGDVL